MPIPLRAIRADGEIQHDSSSLDDLLSLIQKAAERHFGQEGDRELIKQRSDASRAMDTLRACRTTGGAATDESWTAIKGFVESWSAYGKASWRYQAQNRAARLWIGIFGDYCRISTNSLTEYQVAQVKEHTMTFASLDNTLHALINRNVGGIGLEAMSGLVEQTIRDVFEMRKSHDDYGCYQARLKRLRLDMISTFATVTGAKMDIIEGWIDSSATRRQGTITGSSKGWVGSV